jgi:hypothetical protein
MGFAGAGPGPAAGSFPKDGTDIVRQKARVDTINTNFLYMVTSPFSDLYLHHFVPHEYGDLMEKP